MVYVSGRLNATNALTDVDESLFVVRRTVGADVQFDLSFIANAYHNCICLIISINLYYLIYFLMLKICLHPF